MSGLVNVMSCAPARPFPLTITRSSASRSYDRWFSGLSASVFLAHRVQHRARRSRMAAHGTALCRLLERRVCSVSVPSARARTCRFCTARISYLRARRLRSARSEDHPTSDPRGYSRMVSPQRSRRRAPRPMHRENSWRADKAHGLEARVPYLDLELVEFCWRLPTSLKMNSKQGNVLLRNCERGHYPETLARVPKKGFNMPLASWFRKDIFRLRLRCVSRS